jgi:hypothetical protein
MLRHPILATLAAAAVFLASPLHATPPEKQLVEKYESFAGSEKNARELVEGLRDDTKIELSKNGNSTAFTPPTGKMGYGNVDIALGLAQASLAEQGITSPTPGEIKAALNGGTVTAKSGARVTLPGVLELRASGMGWGKVAQVLGFKLGEVVRADNAIKQAQPDAKHHGRSDLHRVKVERPEKFERPHRPERPERPHHGR